MGKKNKPTLAKLIINPGSGRVSKNPMLVEQISSGLLDRGMKVDVAFARPSDKAVGIARKAVKDGYKVIIAMGGDDTIEAVIRGMAGSKARLGIIPGGTENDVALSLGIPEDLDALFDLLTSRKSRKLDLCQVKINKQKMIFFQVLTIGITSKLYPDVKKVPKGQLTKLKDAAVKLVTHPSKPKVNIQLDGGSNFEVETMLVNVANVPMMGMHYKVAPDASVEDGLMDIAVYPGFNKAELLAYFSKLTNEGDVEDGSIQRYRANKAKIKSDPKLEVLADGVMLGKGTVRIKILPNSLRVIAPKPGVGVEKPPEEVSQELPAPVSPVNG